MTSIERIQREIATWEGVESAPHRFGGLEFRVGRRELRHLHGDHFAHPFTSRVRDEQIPAGRACRHHVLQTSGWATKPLTTEDDVDDAIAPLRMKYERATAKRRQ
jgi:hypothetical protein